MRIKSFSVRVHITPDGQTLISTITDFPPGEYDAVLVIEDHQPKMPNIALNLPMVDLGPWPEHLSLHREDL